ncbi:group-specific protein [Aneurinibacillus migulanus]|uniref:Group-specific protein n=1 Tax=Aneurinibacillus migulanus TaxID=47500 RepID=A0A0D1WG75_ANEMI|nr:group-specific protein [Aneurinibacillus migulanus]KIV57535.1 group-specific protein [Aneurinibacillus migulanus]KON94845.1 group-specific protein [Aneurinibacillus migulanus]MED0892895.1 group-specific protein [Aneurinibacillus migulanus]MED1619141.1 group-specific protein [Aneurinibacillus migulanus]SDI91249.1 hypothetical protein SAMN04487909_10967 [Aneurinibacillus migulanus]
MNGLVSINVDIDESEVRELCKQKVAELIKEVDVDFVFWDTSELKRRTCLSWNTIQDQFFFDPRFPKHKVGSKWLFPAKETREFLIRWLSEQPKR